MNSKLIAPSKLVLDIPDDVRALCDIFNITPEMLLMRYMCDLCSLPGNGGSDERSLAKEYFLRGSLSSGVDFDFKEDRLEEFERLYKQNYPSARNITHRTDRQAQLLEMYERIMKLQNGGV